MIDQPIEVLLPAGGRLRFPTWSVLAGVTAATGMHEPSEQRFIATYLRADEGVVDVGANIGIYTVACAELGARVLAFEPSSRARKALEDNIRINGIEDVVRVYASAAGDAAGVGALTTDLDAANHLLDHESTRPSHEVVDVRTLDSLQGEFEDWLAPGRISLLKVDAEGRDLEVLRGGRELIYAHRPVILVETWDGGHKIRHMLAELGYQVYRFDIKTSQLVEYPADWAGQCNFIAVRIEQMADVQRRIDARPLARLNLPRVRWRIDAPETGPTRRASRA